MTDISNASNDLVAFFLEYRDDASPYGMETMFEPLITRATGITPYGMYVQALREARSRYEGLKSMFMRVGELEKIPKKSKEHASAMAELDGLRERVVSQWRHFILFARQARALHDQLGPIDEKARAEFERNYYEIKLLRDVALDILAHGKVQRGTIEAIAYMPKESRENLLQQARVGMNEMSAAEFVLSLPDIREVAPALADHGASEPIGFLRIRDIVE